MTETQARAVKAALELAGSDQKSLANERNVSYSRINRMLRRSEVVTSSYAQLFNRLIRKHLLSFAAAA